MFQGIVRVTDSVHISLFLLISTSCQWRFYINLALCKLGFLGTSSTIATLGCCWLLQALLEKSLGTLNRSNLFPHISSLALTYCTLFLKLAYEMIATNWKCRRRVKLKGGKETFPESIGKISKTENRWGWNQKWNGICTECVGEVGDLGWWGRRKGKTSW